MKSVKVWSLVALCLLSMLSFTACNKDNDTEKTTKKIVEISNNSLKANDFKYDKKGRVTSFVSVEDMNTSDQATYINNYSYGDKMIQLIMQNTAGGSIELNLNLDDKNRIVEAMFGGFRPFKVSYRYDENNHLVAIYKGSILMTQIFWEKGNITDIQQREEEDESLLRTHYTHTNYPTKGIFDAESFGTPDLFSVDKILFAQGYYGVYPKNLIKAKEKENDREEYTYHFGKDGYLQTITTSHDGFVNYSWE